MIHFSSSLFCIFIHFSLFAVFLHSSLLLQRSIKGRFALNRRLNRRKFMVDLIGDLLIIVGNTCLMNKCYSNYMGNAVTQCFHASKRSLDGSFPRSVTFGSVIDLITLRFLIEVFY